MNYSNMIEEKNLKKTFIIATLISTVIGTFTASINLHDRVQDKRKQKAQKQLDNKQDGEIKRLEQQVKRLQGGKSSNGDNDSSSSESSSRGSRRSRKPRRSRDDADDFVRSTQRSRAMIEDSYEDYLSRVGSRYARGDVITENKLQAQVIALQQTVIDVLQDALMSDRNLTKSDIHKLVTAQQAARAGTLSALSDQYQRMQSSRLSLESGTPVQRQRTLPAPQEEAAFVPARRVQSLPVATANSPFCRYSEDLQDDSERGLAPAFNGLGDRRCPVCDVQLGVDQQSYWVFSLPGEAREYSLDARFVIKCHTPDGGFACLLCYNSRDVDCFCGNVESLVKHLGRDHRIEEIQTEVDFERRS